MEVVQEAVVATGFTNGVTASPAGAGLIETGPDRLNQTVTLGEIIAESPHAPVHIIFVHGIRAGDRGTSATFRSNLCARLQGVCAGAAPVSVQLTHRLNVGAWPQLTYMGQVVWPDAAAWAMGPFVDRYEYARSDGEARIVVDEVNWWPLALPLRRLALLEPEACLAGPDVDNLRLCAAVDQTGRPLNDGIHYPFIDKAALDRLIAAKPPGGGAAWANGFVKRALMDWGLSDAVIALGPMQQYLHQAIDQAFAYAAEPYDEQGQAPRYVVVSESLGSFIVLDAYGHGKPAVQGVLDATAYLYFFANQLGLLELARLSDPLPVAPVSAALTSPPPATARLSLHQTLLAWAGRGPHALSPSEPPACKQIIAFSDPSDALTFRVPHIDGLRVVNVYDRNGIDVLHIGADPVAAHTGHSSNPHVLDMMLKRR